MTPFTTFLSFRFISGLYRGCEYPRCRVVHHKLFRVLKVTFTISYLVLCSPVGTYLSTAD